MFSNVSIGGKPTGGNNYYHPCRNTVSSPSGCCARCQADPKCVAWYHERMDCTAYGSGDNRGVCTTLAVASLGHTAPGVVGGGLQILVPAAARAQA